jgi:cephalosporin hydroxylase
MIIELAKDIRRKVNRQLQPIFYDTLIKRIARRGPIEEPSAMFNYMARANLGVLSAIQNRQELIPMLQLIKEAAPATVMEIGTASGGTLFTLTRVARPDATIVSLDLPGGKWGGGYAEKRVPLYEAFALPGQTLRLLREDSHQPEALEHVKQAFGGRTIDFLFIDGDHSYEGVRSDFEMYSPLVTPGGYIGFHDIAYTEGVTRLWSEVKSEFAETREFIATSGQVYGIGLGRTRAR